MLLDISSGNSKGGWMEEIDGEETFMPVAVPWGTKGFTNTIKEMQGGDGFAEAAAKLRIRLLRPAIREEVGRKQGMRNRPRVYLIGGIAWATSTLASRRSQSAFPPLKPQNFDTLYNRAILPNAEQLFCGNPSGEVKKVCQAFAPENLIAGLEILRTFSEEMNFRGKEKVFFVRDSLYAWPMGYIMARCKADNQC